MYTIRSEADDFFVAAVSVLFPESVLLSLASLLTLTLPFILSIPMSSKMISSSPVRGMGSAFWAASRFSVSRSPAKVITKISYHSFFMFVFRVILYVLHILNWTIIRLPVCFSWLAMAWLAISVTTMPTIATRAKRKMESRAIIWSQWKWPESYDQKCLI